MPESTMERYPGLAPVPPRINRLEELATDLWWSWHYRARDVFRLLDYPLWRLTAHNPVRMLRLVPPERLARAAEDPAFVALYDEVMSGLDKARSARDTWWARRFGNGEGPKQVAYFSAEFAVHQSLPLYAGGLGVLAGDTCKEASDLGVPLVGVGFMYPQGYFHQHLSAEGWQQETYERLDWLDAPIQPATRSDGMPCVVAVPLGDRTVLAAVWVVQAGRVKLYLLDTDLQENAPWDRELSARLYGGNQETRIQQEIVLGLGGVRALHALGVQPDLWHLNEGHAAFVVLQRVRELIEQGHAFEQAVAEVRRDAPSSRPTRPVPAGHDAFPFHLVETYLAGAWGSLGDLRDQFLALGAYDNGNGNGMQFNMTALALRSAGQVNARERAAPRRHAADVVSDLARHPGRIRARARHHQRGARSDLGCRGALEALRDPRRARLAAAARRRGDVERRARDPRRASCGRCGRRCAGISSRSSGSARAAAGTTEAVAPGQVVAAGTLLNPDALTIGFARRFTAYKRPGTDLPRPRAPAAHPLDAAAAGAGRLRRQVAPRRRQRQAPPAADLQARDGLRLRRAGSRSSTTTTCTSRTSSCRAATSG